MVRGSIFDLSPASPKTLFILQPSWCKHKITEATVFTHPVFVRRLNRIRSWGIWAEVFLAYFQSPLLDGSKRFTTRSCVDLHFRVFKHALHKTEGLCTAPRSSLPLFLPLLLSFSERLLENKAQPDTTALSKEHCVRHVSLCLYRILCDSWSVRTDCLGKHVLAYTWHPWTTSDRSSHQEIPQQLCTGYRKTYIK